ncbi:MFS transporter [Cryobacterium sp. AP23]
MALTKQQTAAGPDTRRWLTLCVLALAQLMVVLDGTIVNIALPSLQQDLGFGDANRQWLVTGYALAFGSLLLLGGRLSDFFGRKRMFVIGLIGFAAASGLGGLANGFAPLLVARILQGGFGAVLAPAALSLLTVTFPEKTARIRAFAIWGAVSSAGGAVGLLLGGVLTEYASWRWCLFVNLPIAVVALVGTPLMPRSGRPIRSPLDLPGVATAVAGLVGIVYGLSQAETYRWGSAWVLMPIIGGLVCLVVFVLIERRAASPLLPLRIVLDRNRGGAYLTSLLVNAGLLGVFLFGTYYMSGILKFTPVQTGFAFLPTVVTIVITTSLAGSRLGSRFGPRSLVTSGGLVATAGLLLLLRAGIDTSYISGVLPGLIVFGVGLGLIWARLQNAATAGAGARDSGVASAMANTSQQIGGSIGTALLSSIAASAGAAFIVDKTPTALLAAQATVYSYHVAFAVAAVFYFASAVIGFTLFRGDLGGDPVNAEPTPKGTL